VNINNVAAISSFIYCFYRKDKKLKIKEIDDFRPYFYVLDPEGEYNSIYGEKLRRVMCEEPYEVYETRKFYGKNFEADVHYPNRFLIDKVDEIESESIRKRFLDIEIRSEGGGLNVDQAKDSILSNTVYDSFEEKYHVFVWHERVKKLFLDLADTEIHLFDNEKDMLESWMIWERKNVADIWWGWYADKFDYPYLYNRIGGESFKFLSPIEYCIYNERYGINLAGIYLADLLSHYKKLSAFLHGERSSYSLDYIGKTELGEGKERNLSPLEITKMWKEDPEFFVRYNHKDVKLMVGIEAKYHITEYIDALRKISHSTFDDTLSYATMVDNSLLRLAHENKIVLPSKQKVKNEKKKGPEVFDVKSGLYRNVIMLDLTALYPNIIRSLNLSPETQSDDGEIIVDDKRFKRSPVGLLPRAVKQFQDNREDQKEKMFKEKEGSAAYIEYDMKQRALKALNNAQIGYIAYNNSRFYSKDIFEAVTYTARQIQRATKELLEEGGYAEVIMGDSLDYDREIVIKNINSKKIEFVPIGRFVEEFDDCSDYETLCFNEEKHEVVFSPIRRGIVHDYEGKLLRITTNRGRTVVTPQHSVYRYINGLIDLCDASNLKVGDFLVSLLDIPFSKPLYKEGNLLDISQLDFFHDCLRGYKMNVSFGGRKGVCPLCSKFYKNLSSHISYAHNNIKRSLDDLSSEYKYIGDENRRCCKIPRFWKLSEDFAWILGYWCADGSVSTKESANRWMVSFGSQNKKLIIRVKTFFDNILEKDYAIIESIDNRTNRKMYYYRIVSKVLSVLFQDGLKMGVGSNKKKVPFVILNGNNKLKKAFIQGYFDGDGSYSAAKKDDRFVNFTSKSSSLINQVSFLLKQMDFGETKKTKKSINEVAYKYREDKPSITQIKTVSSSCLENEIDSIGPAKINKIEEIGTKKNKVYDIEVCGNHNFVDSEGLILVHNTDALYLILKEECDDYIEMGKKIQSLVNKNLDEVIKQFNIKVHSFEYKFEKFYKSLLIFTKKRYVGLLTWREGEDMEKLDDVGVETRRSSTPEIVKNIQMELFKMVLYDVSKEELDYRVEEIWKEYETFPLEDIAFVSGFNKPIADYKCDSIHIRAIKNSMKIGLDFNVGEKIKWLYIQDEDFDVLAFRDIDGYIEKVREYNVNWTAMKDRLKKNINMIYEALGWSFPESIDGSKNGKQQSLF